MQKIKLMIQRVQSIYMFLSFLVMSVLLYFVPTFNGVDKYYIFDDKISLTLAQISGILSIIAIFLYQNRKLQFVMNRISILLNLILLGLFIFQLTNVSGAEPKAMKGIEMGVFLPIISVILLVLANKAIQKDEDLVKSVDRIR